MASGYVYTPCYNKTEKYFETCFNYEPWGNKCKKCSRNVSNIELNETFIDNYKEEKQNEE